MFCKADGSPLDPGYIRKRVIYPAINSLPPKQTLSYSIDVEALRPGDVRFRAELRSATLREPVIEEESTNIYPPNASAAPAEAPAPGTAPVPPPLGQNSNPDTAKPGPRT